MKNLLLLFLFSLSIFGFAQEVISTHYTSNDGLSSDIVYASFQDSKGYLWFGTNAGISRFDGIEWENYSYEEHISGIDIYQIYEDKSGRIWFLCGNGSLCYYSYNNNTITPIQKNLSEINEGSFLVGFIDFKGNLFWGSNAAGIVQLDENGKIKNHVVNNCNRSVGYFFEYESELYAISGGCLLKYDETSKAFFKNQTLPSQNYIAATVMADTLFLAKKNIVYKYRLNEFEKTDSIVLPAETSVLYLNHDHDENLLIGTTDGIYQNNTEWNQLPGNLISEIIVDHERGIWISTLNDGIFYLRNNKSILYRSKGKKDLNLTTFIIDPESTSINVGNYTTIDLMDGKYGFDGAIDPSHIFFRESIYEIRNKTTIDYSTIKYEKKIISARMFQVVDSMIFYSRHSGLYAKPIHTKGDWEETCFHRGNVNFFLIDGNKKWVGDNLGLWLITDGETKHLHPDINVTSIKLHGEYVYVTTRGNGLYIYKDSLLYAKIGESDGLNDAFCHSTFEDAKGRIWVATWSGVTIISQVGDRVRLNGFSVGNNSIGNIISDIDITEDGYLWFQIYEGIIQLDYPTRIASEPAGVEIKSVFLNDEKINPSSMSSLSYDENNIKIELAGLTYKSPPTFTYRLIGGREDWSTTDNPHINLLSLGPGDYQFEAYSISVEGIKSENKVELAFTIRPPFWKSNWFFALIFILLVLIIYLFFKIRVLTYNGDVVRDILLSLSKKLSREQFILVKNVKNGAQTKLSLDQIIRIKGAKDYVLITTTKEEVMVKMTMKLIIEELNKKEWNFYRIHQSHIINIKHVKAIHGDFVTLNDEEIPVGRAFKKEAQKMKERLFS